jgi:uncharacterized protein (TIGR03067 family)
MRIIAAFLLGFGLVGGSVLAAGKQADRQEKKDEKKEENKDNTDVKDAEVPALEGKYTLVDGKINNKAIGDDTKKWEYTFTSDRITIKSPFEKKEDKQENKKENKPLMLVIKYKIDVKTKPMNIDMEILEGPEGTKGIKTSGIFELKGDVLKLAYIMEKDKRPKTFEGKEGNMFELKKLK